MPKSIISQNGIIKNYNVNRKTFYDQPIDSPIKQYKEIRKLTLKNNHRLIAFDFEQTEIIRGCSENNSANRICSKIKRNRN